MSTYLRPPILQVHSFADNGDPEPLGTNPLAGLKLGTAPGKEAVKLFDQACAACERLESVKAAANSSAGSLTHAQEELAAEVERGACSGDRDTTRERELIVAVQEAEIVADVSLHQRRFRAALQSQTEAARKWKNYVRTHIAELIEGELEPFAERVTEELATAEGNPQGTTVAALAAARDAYSAMRQQVEAFRPFVRDPARFELPGAPAVPLPPAESYRVPAPDAESDAAAEATPVAPVKAAMSIGRA